MTPQIKQRIEQIRRGEVPDGYKKTPVGIVPAEWATCKMSDIYSERKEPGDPALPILTVSIHSGVSKGELDESELGKKIKRIEDRTQYLRARKNDLVFNMMRAWQGAIGIVQTDGLVSPAYIVAKPVVAFCPAFMDLYIKLPETIHRLHKKSYGVTDFRLRLYWDSFIQIDCCLPPLSEQEKIAEILKTQDRVITLYEKKVDQLKKLKKVFLQKMFPKPGKNVPEWRFPGFTDAWEQRKFSEFAQRETAFRSSSSECPSIEYEDVVAEEGRLNKDVRQKEARKNGIVFDGTQVLYGKLRPYLHNWLNPDFTGVAVGDWWVLRPVGMDKKFLYRLIQTQQFDDIANQSSGSKMPRADWKLVSNTEFIIPSSLDEQKQIAETFDSIDNLITLHQRKCDEEKQKKKALMQLLLTGIVRVKV